MDIDNYIENFENFCPFYDYPFDHEEWPKTIEGDKLRILWDKCSQLIDEILWRLAKPGRLNELREYSPKYIKAFFILYSKLHPLSEYTTRDGHFERDHFSAARFLAFGKVDDLTDPELLYSISLVNLSHAIDQLGKPLKEIDADYAQILSTEADALLTMAYAIAALESKHQNDPDKLRGAKVLASARAGGRKNSIWAHRAQELQEIINKLHKENPGYSYEHLKRIANKNHNISFPALRRYTLNPREKKT